MRVRMHALFIAIAYYHSILPAPDKTFSEDPGKENERRRKLEVLEKRAPSPLILTHTSSFGHSY